MNHFKSELELLQKIWSDEPSELSVLRQKAFNRFSELGFPTKKWEDWQFTDFSPFEKTEFRMTTPEDVPSLDTVTPSPIGDAVYSILVLNGHYQPQLSDVPDGVKIRTLLDVFLKDSSLGKSLTDENPFSALNTSLMNSGLAIDIGDRVELDKPIHYRFITTDVKEPAMNHPRLLIRLGKHSSASIIEHYESHTVNAYWNNSVTIAELGKNSSLTHVRIQKDTGYHTCNMEYHLQEDATMNSLHFNRDTTLYRGDSLVRFHGENANANLNGLSLLKNHEHSDSRIVVDHSQPNCTSKQFFKTILNDNSGGVFNGRVIVRENSQKTDSSQSNKNLLLSKSASMHSNPQLEINADDVRCSHGSTTGQLNEDALYYLRSRGIDISTARLLMVEGFGKEVLSHINHESLAKYLNENLVTWLEGLSHG